MFRLVRLKKRAKPIFNLRKTMKNLRRLGVSAALLSVLAITALAGETNSPPCADPGETNSPPCAMAQEAPDDSVAPVAVNSAPASDSGVEYSVAREVVLDLALLLF
jgi:hypothetical protein